MLYLPPPFAHPCCSPASALPPQVTGEAQYTDDIKLTSDALVAVLVTSSKPHARITNLDATAALQVREAPAQERKGSRGRGARRPRKATVCGTLNGRYDREHHLQWHIRLVKALGELGLRDGPFPPC